MCAQGNQTMCPEGFAKLQKDLKSESVPNAVARAYRDVWYGGRCPATTSKKKVRRVALPRLVRSLRALDNFKAPAVA